MEEDSNRTKRIGIVMIGSYDHFHSSALMALTMGAMHDAPIMLVAGMPEEPMSLSHSLPPKYEVPVLEAMYDAPVILVVGTVDYFPPPPPRIELPPPPMVMEIALRPNDEYEVSLVRESRQFMPSRFHPLIKGCFRSSMSFKKRSFLHKKIIR